MEFRGNIVTFAFQFLHLIIQRMPKIKTNSGAKKRFKVTGTGKIKRKHAFHSHILTKKTTKQKRNLVHATLVSPADMDRVNLMLGL